MQASAEQARYGCTQPVQGYMQVCHGKHAQLLRVPPGDRMAYYAPALAMGGKNKLQSFVPYRSNVAYLPAAKSPIVPLLDRLELTADQARWGYRLRFGLIWICYIFDSYSGRLYLGTRPKTLQISSGPLKSKRLAMAH